MRTLAYLICGLLIAPALVHAEERFLPAAVAVKLEPARSPLVQAVQQARRNETRARFNRNARTLGLAAAGTVPGWQRYAPTQAKLAKTIGAPAETTDERAARVRPIGR